MEGAAAAYRKALVIDPDLVPAIVNLANIHYARDEMIEAQALYERAIGLDPDCFEAYFNLGNIHHDLGRYDDALRCYRGAVRLNAGVSRCALLSGGDAREDRALTRSQAALEGVSGSRAEWRVGRPGEGVQRVDARLGTRNAEPVELRTGTSVHVVVAGRASWACGGACRTRTRGTRTRA